MQRGAAGTEQLSRWLNSYLGQMIDVVTDHGGDISKIVGDALIPVWPAVDEDLASATRRAAICGLSIATEFAELVVEGDLRLSVKVGLCAGEIAATHVGGIDGRWLFLVAGEGVSQLSGLEQQMQTGAVVASADAWGLVSNRFVGQPLQSGHVRISAMGQHDLAHRPLQPVALSAEQEPLVRAFIPEVCLSRLDAGQADWLAELRRTTVVFVDIRGVGTATPDALQLLQRVTQAAQRAFIRYDGWLKEITMDDKGTALVAAFGVPPFTHEDDAARAVQAALTIRSEIRALGLGAGIGIATGPAFCGPVGNPRRRDFAVLGQHVNLASRLKHASTEGDVLCDAATFDEAGRRLNFERLPAYVLKGMPHPIDVYRVRAAEAVAGRPDALIDRTSELESASSTLQALEAGTGGLVVLEGEPGIGKSRLVNEWLRRARVAGVRTLIGEAAAIEGSTPYHAWRAVFEQLFDLEAIADHDTRRGIVMDRLRSDEESYRLAPLLDPVLSLDLPDDEVTSQLTGLVRADNTRDLLIRLLSQAASRTPLLVVLEDIHWLDSASWSLLLRAHREIPSLLVVVTRRPMGDVSLDLVGALGSDATTLQIGALSHVDALALACERTGASRVDGQVAAVVQERAEGNPLFIEQLTYAMRDSGRIVIDNGLVRAASDGEDLKGVIPDTVQRVITSRLDQLRPEESMTLKVASVIGQRFALRTLADIYPLPVEAPALLDHLTTLIRLDLLAPAPSAPEMAYEFRHVITQEVAYNLMLSTQAQQLHERLAAWYERTYESDLSPFHAFLAHHWQKAGRADRAVSHLDLAGGQALRTFANEEAIGFLEQALSLQAEAGLQVEPARQARWQLQLGEAYVHMSRYREGREHLVAGLRLLKRPAPATRRQQVVWLIGELARQSLRRAGIARPVRAATDAERNDLVVVFRAYERLAEASYYLGESLLPLYCVIRILNDAEASGIPAEIARGLAGTGALFGVVPLPRIAEWYLHRALDRLNEVEDLTTHEIVQIVVGFYYNGAGMWDVARDRLTTVRRIARRLGDRRRFDDALSNLVELECLQGSFSAAARLADELTASAGARHDRRFEAEGLAGKAYASWQLGETAEALRALAALDAIVSQEIDMTDELKVKHAGLVAILNLGRGQKQGALAASERAMRLTAHQRPTYFGTFLGYVGPVEAYLSLWEAGDGVGDARSQSAEALARLRRFASVFPIGRPRYATLEGRYHGLLGNHRQAIRSWRRSLAKAQELSMTFEQGLAHYEMGRHLAAGDPARASHLQEAVAIFRRLKASQALVAAEDAARASAPRS
ncbi:MAG: AAA family ATPase [Candidatus Limnocylindria bacterium]